MKKIFIILTAFSITLASCGEEKKGDETTDNENKEAGYTIKENTAIIKWTAFKTTEKLPVGGEFTEVKLSDIPTSEKAHLAVDGLSFSIPVSSLYTNNDSRDSKLKELFFGVMESTEMISGTFKNLEGDETKGHGLVDLKMNNVSCDLPFDYTIENNEFKLISNLNILSWKAQAALDSLNKACYDLHKGADGISKTWEDVDINASIELEKK